MILFTYFAPEREIVLHMIKPEHFVSVNDILLSWRVILMEPQKTEEANDQINVIFLLRLEKKNNPSSILFLSKRKVKW